MKDILKRKRTIIWDFNGTLLNDTQLCIDCMNILLEERGLPFLDVSRYREIFTFPVRDYYVQLGFDFNKEPFEIPAHQFIDLYRERLKSAPLQANVENLLQYFREKGFSQIILSAMEQNFLEEVLMLKGITGYFDIVAGIRDHLAEGKAEMAKEIFQHHDPDKDDYILIGDTIHDYEVAAELGIECILVAHGHHSFERLNKLGCLVLEKLEQLKTKIK
jgi:phosphoglycolate phosphatase